MLNVSQSVDDLPLTRIDICFATEVEEACTRAPCSSSTFLFKAQRSLLGSGFPNRSCYCGSGIWNVFYMPLVVLSVPQ